MKIVQIEDEGKEIVEKTKGKEAEGLNLRWNHFKVPFM